MELLLASEEETSLLDKIEYKLFEENRVIYLSDSIHHESVDRAVKMINYINSIDEGVEVKDRKPIHLHIMSEGGSAYCGWRVVSVIEKSKTPVWTYCDSFAMSMALPIFLAGQRRFLSEYATLLYHELRGQNDELTRQELKRVDKEYDRLQKIYDDYIIGKTKVTQDVLDDHQEKVSDWYIDFETATKYEMYTDVL